MKKFVVAICVAIQACLIPVVTEAAQPTHLSPENLWPSDFRAFVSRLVEKHQLSLLGRKSVARAQSQANVLDQPIANPELELSGTNRDTDVQPNGEKPEAERSREIGISLTTDFGIKQSIQRQLGLKEVAIAEQISIGRRLDVAGHVISSLAAFYATDEEAKLASRQEHVMGQFIKQAHALRNSGETNATDLTLAKLALADTARTVLEAKGRFDQATLDLQALCQCNLSSLPKLPKKLPAFRKPDFDKVIEALPSIRASEIAVERAALEIKLAKAERIPDPTFSINGGTEGKARFISLGLSVPLPVLRSGSAEVVAAESAFTEAEQEKLAESFVRKRQAISSFQNYDLARRSYELWEAQNFGSIEEQSKLLNRLWRAGEIGATEYLVKIKETIEATKNGARLKGQAWAALSQWLIHSNQLQNFLGEN